MNQPRLSKGGEAPSLLKVAVPAILAAGSLMGFFTWVFTDLGGAMLQQPAMLWGLCWRAEHAWRASPGAGSRRSTVRSSAS